MIRPPPTSPLFPYPPLFRSSPPPPSPTGAGGTAAKSRCPPAARAIARPRPAHPAPFPPPRSSPTRSEEHTSELQSRQYLVCRLLLEKKKKKFLQSALT